MNYAQVRNIVDFGAFVDIGAGQDALLHVSKMRRLSGVGRVSNPQEVLAVSGSI